MILSNLPWRMPKTGKEGEEGKGRVEGNEQSGGTEGWREGDERGWRGGNMERS
jgi:hypothetical protein